ncbi:D-cysteine desulfhydrase family protein [Microvirga rosea]|uniref:D-cysteine desulfhydrase family protein n=1 Tax=Microvirga rosea TaxID=2715425 RepID=UPI001D09C6C2|nr:D-cysteine desulfhydrase family protein [Microvirga rosea]MCB8823199.1 D-cysteine desulfhydrase family protein [Microvirga rosea]
MTSTYGLTARFNHISLLSEETPLVEHSSLGERLSGIRLFIKRDDIATVGGGGNKLRKLEFAVGKALEEGADTLVTFGALQSNHARLTAAVAAKLGMQCELVLSKRVPRSGILYENNGNVLLTKLFGANVHILSPDADPLEWCAHHLGVLRQQGRKPYVIPFGGSDCLGALGMAHCAFELIDQLKRQNAKADHVVVASGSGGTQAGLLAGLHAAGSDARVHGISVLHPAEKLCEIVSSIAKEACTAMGDKPFDASKVQVNDRYVGAGYGIPYDGVLDSIRMLAGTEGVLLDPVYTGKAFTGLRELAEQGAFAPGETVVFIHTGGLPGLFAYSDEFTSAEMVTASSSTESRAYA